MATLCRNTKFIVYYIATGIILVCNIWKIYTSVQRKVNHSGADRYEFCREDIMDYICGRISEIEYG